ncbi:MAG: ComEC/Rec2 family competence protein [Ekhidna sp.]|uniref:ComEC/Rec2 family competence protein n=1 Tax=Ekhidna sp. TaxID=2608089 RepID=UPI0032ED0009
MYFWNTYPFVRLTIALILGILCFDLYPILWARPILLCGSSVIIFGVLVLLSHKLGFYKLRHANGVMALFIIFIFGGCFNLIKYHSHSSHHYLNQTGKISGFTGTIISPVNERTNHYRYDFELSYVITDSDSLIEITGKIHLYIRKDSSALIHNYGDQLNVYGRFYPVPGPDNPGEFNYQLYLARQNIYSHAFVQHSDVKVVANNPPSQFMRWAYSLRSHASETIDKNMPDPRENGIAKALLLGIKDHLDNDVKKAYSSAGAMHVLAVSGLHVGIIYLIIQIFFGKLRQSGKWGKITFGAISVFTIWLYATVTGLSPSVLRAATMFSLVAISQSTMREGNIYNTLGFAAFLLLIYDPYLIYSVGFQLSFAAVIGIVYLQPKLYRLLNFRTWILDKAWAITCVSIAAQLATFPLSAYYFHQFPTYFLASNLIVIPASFLMLISGVLMLLIDPILTPVSEVIGQLLNKFMWLINEIISLVHILPNSLVEWISLDKAGLILTYAIVFTLVAGVHYRSFKTLIVSCFLGLIFINWAVVSHELQSEKRELVFYEISNKTAIDFIDGHKATLYIDEFSPDELELLSFQINPNRLSSHLRPISESILSFQHAGFEKKEAIQSGMIAGKKFIIFDSTTFHLDFGGRIETDFIILNNQSVKSLEWLKEHFATDLIIVGNKNSMYYSRKMRAQAKEQRLTIHSLKEDGALRFPLQASTKKERTILPALFTTNPD